MADFYLLPPRPVVGEELARVVRAYLPGLRVTPADCVRFLENLVDQANGRAFLVHAEDLPDGEDVVTALQDGFGAEPADRVIVVSAGPRAEVLPVGEAVAVG
jgi:hypothetical protein